MQKLVQLDKRRAFNAKTPQPFGEIQQNGALRTRYVDMLQSSDIRLALTVGLVTHAQNDLWRAVVARHHVRGHEEAGGGRPGQAKVEDLQRTVGFHYYVTGFQILGREEVKGQQSCHVLRGGNL